MEIWLDIDGYDGIYKVSNFGKVKSIDRTYLDKNGKLYNVEGKIMNFQDNGKGYKNINLYKDKKSKCLYIHRLVADAFLPKIHGKNFVNHIDGDKSNNELSNLEWVNRSENMLHANKLGLCKGYDKSGDKNPSSKLVLDTQTGIYYLTLKEASFYKNINYTSLSSMMNSNKNKTSLIYV
jgi:hypothetical protein